MTLSSAVFLLSLLTSVSGMEPAELQVPLRFCFEDKQLLPYYAGEGAQVASPPGVTIEHLQAAITDVPQLQMQLQRKPWLRCLQLLQQNKVDALVATYATSRTNFAVFPMRQAGVPDANLALSQHATCLVQRSGDNLMQRLNAGVVIARPLGYVTPMYPQGVNIVEVQSQQQAFKLVQEGRVDATTSLCEVNHVPLPSYLNDALQVLRPPLYHTTGYLVFSRAFYQQHPAVAQQLWQALKKHRLPERYFQYLQAAEQQPATGNP